MDYINQIILGNALNVLKKMPDNYIDLDITSPPYDDLRLYKKYSFNFEDIASELFRVIKRGGVLVWIIGDSVINGSESGTSFKQALYFKKVRFNLHDTMIYAKNGFRYPEKIRYNQQFEYMFIFTKGQPKTFNPIKYRHTTNYVINKLMTQRYKNGTLKKIKYSSTSKDIPLGNIWFYDVGYMKSTKDKIAYNHPAIFPERLAEDHILSWSDPEDIVMDCMCGSGTVCKAAKRLNRKYVGIDISNEYVDIAKKRISKIQSNLF